MRGAWFFLALVLLFSPLSGYAAAPSAKKPSWSSCSLLSKDDIQAVYGKQIDVLAMDFNNISEQPFANAQKMAAPPIKMFHCNYQLMVPRPKNPAEAQLTQADQQSYPSIIVSTMAFPEHAYPATPEMQNNLVLAMMGGSKAQSIKDLGDMAAIGEMGAVALYNRSQLRVMVTYPPNITPEQQKNKLQIEEKFLRLAFSRLYPNWRPANAQRR